MDLLREGLTNEGIAERLGISRDGAKYHVSEILSKLGLRSRKEAARWEAEGRRRWWEAVPGLEWLGGWAGRGQVSGVAGKAARAVSALVVGAAVGGLSLIAALALRDGGEAETPRVAAPTSVLAEPSDAAPPVLVATVPDLIAAEVVWAPEGDSFAFEKEDGIYVARSPDFKAEQIVSIGPASRLGGSFQRIAWSPDGERLAFSGSRDEDDAETIYVVNADGSGPRDVLPGDEAATGSGTAAKWPNVWLDSDTIAFDAYLGTGLQAPMTVNIETGEVGDVIERGPDNPPAGGPGVIWSPDRRWIAFHPSVPQPNQATMRVANVATGEDWSFPGIGPLSWLPDSSAVVYMQSGEDGVLALAHVEEQRFAQLSDETHQARGLAVSPDGRHVAVEGLSQVNCEPPVDSAATGGMCVHFIDVGGRATVSTVFLPYGRTIAGSGPYGLRGWVGQDAVAFIGPLEEALSEEEPLLRALWLVSNPEDPEAIIWQVETPGEGEMGVDAAPDGRYAVVTMPTSGNLFPAVNYWEARVYEMR